MRDPAPLAARAPKPGKSFSAAEPDGPGLPAGDRSPLFPRRWLGQRLGGHFGPLGDPAPSPPTFPSRGSAAAPPFSPPPVPPTSAPESGVRGGRGIPAPAPARGRGPPRAPQQLVPEAAQHGLGGPTELPFQPLPSPAASHSLAGPGDPGCRRGCPPWPGRPGYPRVWERRGVRARCGEIRQGGRSTRPSMAAPRVPVFYLREPGLPLFPSSTWERPRFSKVLSRCQVILPSC